MLHLLSHTEPLRQKEEPQRRWGHCDGPAARERSLAAQSTRLNYKACHGPYVDRGDHRRRLPLPRRAAPGARPGRRHRQRREEEDPQTPGPAARISPRWQFPLKNFPQRQTASYPVSWKPKAQRSCAGFASQ
ncbi:hypothetical protein AAFF_G00166880 [Aldrovandia affinis]|uniref:Uncharacterized protein n=1 Tax=Aldrovandia affinis TaxID=143900 RepID=A0AAD7RM70_9TELE|nr:hypothetical protein AAFF_G00166880 [Aldrovandia affinis]